MITAQIEPDAIVIETAGSPRLPIREVRWMDERALCGLAHRAVAPDYAPGEPNRDAALPDFRACPSYRAARCALAHDGAPCLFAELPDSEGWQRVRQHRLLPDGTVCTVDSYPVLLPLIANRPHDPAYRQLPDGTYCLAENWESLNAILTQEAAAL